MSHFYATIPISARKTVASARGHKNTGLVTRAASWQGAIEVELYHDDETDLDGFVIRQVPHMGQGISEILGRGILGKPMQYRKVA